MYFCGLTRGNVAIASINDLTLMIGRTAYLYTHASAQYVCGRHDPELAYILEPGDCRLKETEYDVLVSANSMGLRDDESSIDNPEIVILGDSHSMGQGVEQDKIFAALIEKESGLKVLNTGISSYGTAREMMMLRRLNIENVEYLIIQYCRNDIDENKAYASLGGRLNIMSNDKYETIKKIDIDRYQSFFDPGTGVAARALENFTGAVSALLGENAETVNEIEAFRYVLSQNMDLIKDRKIIILDINGHNKYDNLFINNAKQNLEDLDLDLRFIDVSEILNDDDYYVLDNHMRASGHQKVADAILRAIGAQSAAGSAQVIARRP